MTGPGGWSSYPHGVPTGGLLPMLALLGGELWTGLNTISVKCFLLMKYIHSERREYKIIKHREAGAGYVAGYYKKSLNVLHKCF